MVAGLTGCGRRLDLINRRAQPNARELGDQRFSVAERQFPLFSATGQGPKAADNSKIKPAGHVLPLARQSANHNGGVFPYFSQQPAPCPLRFRVHLFPPLWPVPRHLTSISQMTPTGRKLLASSILGTMWLGPASIYQP